MSKAIRRAITIEDEHGTDSQAFEDAWTSVKRSFRREVKDVVNEDNGNTFCIELTDERKARLVLLVSHHAIDRASTRVWELYKKYRNNNEEGLASWLKRMGKRYLSLQVRVKGPGFCEAWKGLKFAFALNGIDSKGAPTLTMKTIVEA